MHLAMQYAGGVGAEGGAADESLKLLRLLIKASTAQAAAGGLSPRSLDVNVIDREKRTPLHWAACQNALPCVSALVDAGADVNARDWAQHSPLHFCCHFDAVRAPK